MADQANFCPISRSEASVSRWADRFGEQRLLNIYDCQRCGEFAMTLIEVGAVTEIDNSERLKVTSCLRERTIQGQELNVVIFRRDRAAASDLQVIIWEDLVNAFPQTVADRLDRTLLNLAKLLPTPGQSVVVDANFGPVTFAENHEAMVFILEALEKAGFVATSGNTRVRLTAEGWNRIGDLRKERGREGAKQAFVAMMASGEWEPVCAAIKKGIEAAGYAPYVVMEIEHSQKIDDMIIGEIRRSRFIVADFTGHRQSVYFEAGFAMGLNLPIIWTCREDEIKDAHFDTRQYNHIIWETFEELTKRLTERIRAVVL